MFRRSFFFNPLIHKIISINENKVISLINFDELMNSTIPFNSLNSLLICTLLEKSTNQIFMLCMKSELFVFEDLNIRSIDMYIITSKNTHFSYFFHLSLIIIKIKL